MLLVDGHGIPLSLVVIGANRHDASQLRATLDAVVVLRPSVTPRTPQHLCADAGFVGMPALHEMFAQDYTPHVRPRGEERTERGPGQARTALGRRSDALVVQSLSQVAGPL